MDLTRMQQRALANAETLSDALEILFNQSQHNTLTNGLHVVAIHFDENAKVCRDEAAKLTANQELEGFMTARGASLIGDQMERQAQQTRDLLDLIHGCEAEDGDVAEAA